MKTKALILAALIGLTIQTYAQTIPNAGFENWTTSVWGYDNPDNWETSNAQLACSEIKKDSNFYQGNFAAQILTIACAGWAQIQFPITTHPLNLNCYVRTSLIGTDTVLIRIELLKNGNIVDNGLWTNTTNIDSFALITIPITQNASIIDSALVYMQSGNNSGTELIADNLYFDFISSIEEKKNNSSCTLYPNPVNDKLTIFIESINSNYIIINIFNTQGKEIYSEITNEYSGVYIQELDVSKFSKGLYTVQAIIGDKIITKKIIIN